ncbi:MAG: hypothetical protein Q9162_003372 [Coniocarpon cinnabarinum]
MSRNPQPPDFPTEKKGGGRLAPNAVISQQPSPAIDQSRASYKEADSIGHLRQPLRTQVTSQHCHGEASTAHEALLRLQTSVPHAAPRQVSIMASRMLLKCCFALLPSVISIVAAQTVANGQVVYTYQTLTAGSVETASTTYALSSSSEASTCPCSASATATTYTVNPADLAYPVYQNASAAEADGRPTPDTLNATEIINLGLQLISLGGASNSTNCQTCKDALTQFASTLAARQEDLAIIAEPFCQTAQVLIPFNICLGLFHTGSTDLGGIFPAMDTQGEDGQTACAFIFGLCDLPPPPPLDLATLFKNTTKPPPKTLTPSDKEPLKVLHISDYHLDQRFVVGSEASCGNGQVCCRVFPYTNTSAPINETANLFGNYLCDTPEPLATSVFRNLPKATGLNWCDFSFALFTGDLVSHDIWELTPEYVLAEELSSYQQFFNGLGGVTVYPTLGNHDTYPQAFNAWPNQNGVLPENASYPVQSQYNYEAVQAAWTNYGWLSAEDAQSVVSTGLAIYRTKTPEGLVIISLNSDAFYYFNFYSYINIATVDNTGVLTNLIDYLLDAEKADEPVWIMQHVPPGGSSSYNSLPQPSDLFYQIVDRFNNTIRGTFFGHTHSDEFSVFYANNATSQTPEDAVAVAWIGPSVTPYTNLNAGFRYYLVDPDTFLVRDSINYIANISNAALWETQGDVDWEFEYSARGTYDAGNLLPADAPLDGEFWAEIAFGIAVNETLFERYTDLRQKLYRPYANVTGVERQCTLCGLTSMSVPIFERCLNSSEVLGAFL